MHIPDTALNEMLKQLPKEQRRTLAHIISGKITHQVHCNGQDSYMTLDEPVLKDGEQVLDSEGKPKTQKVEQLVREGCKGQVIAYICQDGIDPTTRTPRYHVEPAIVDGAMKLRSVRKRLDGFYGFQCWCGGDSRIAQQEAGSIKYDGQPPTRDGLEAIYGRLKKNPVNYPEVDGVREVDGFSIERVV